MDHNSYHYINQDYNRYRNDYGSMYNGNENYNINYPNLMPYQNDQPQPAPARQRIRENPPMKSPSIFVYPENVPNALSLIEQALGGETEDRIFYGFLIENAPSEEDARIIDSIRQDEIVTKKKLSSPKAIVMDSNMPCLANKVQFQDIARFYMLCGQEFILIC